MPLGSKLEEEQKKSVEALIKFRDDLIEGKKEILSETKVKKSDIEEIVIDLLPDGHNKLHDDIRKFIEHSPESKLHGDHHDFTESIRVRLEHMIVAIFKGLGGIILLSLAIGLYAWVKQQVK